MGLSQELNKDLDRGIIVVSENWEFGASEPLGFPHVLRVHGVLGMIYLCFEFVHYCAFLVSVNGDNNERDW